jgi:hypothetical protein
MSLFEHVPHPHAAARRAQGPVKTADHAGTGINARLALVITKGVGSMYCAYAFGIFDLFALPTALKAGMYGIVQWTASFFLQLVLLSIILVGQNITSAAADKRSEQTYQDAEMVLHESQQIQDHLAAQDKYLTKLTAQMQDIVSAQGAGSAAAERLSPPSQPTVSDSRQARDAKGKYL